MVLELYCHQRVASSLICVGRNTISKARFREGQELRLGRPMGGRWWARWARVRKFGNVVKLLIFNYFGHGGASAPSPANGIFRTEATPVTDFQEWFWLSRTEATPVTDFQE